MKSLRCFFGVHDYEFEPTFWMIRGVWYVDCKRCGHRYFMREGGGE